MAGGAVGEAGGGALTPEPGEQPLAGGNVSAGVVRVGDTVRRPAGPWTAAVHALLTHLHQAGFRAAPRPLGIDERGRETLTFMPGRRTRSMHAFLREQSARGAEPWSTLWAAGHGTVWRSDAEYIEEREDTWTRALLDG